MNNVLIAPRNFWDLMVLSTSIAPATGFEIVNTQNRLRSKFWQSPDATAQSAKGSMASGSFTCNAVWMHPHECHGGLIRVRGFSNNDWTGATLFDVGGAGSTAIYTPITTGYDAGYSDYPGADTHDPRGPESAFYATFATAVGVKSVQWDFSSKSTTYGRAYWKVGRFFVGNYLQHAVNMRVGAKLGRGEISNGQVSAGGSYLATRGAKWPTYEFDLPKLSNDEAAAWNDIHDQAQTSGDIGYSMYPGAGGREERDGVGIGLFQALDVIGKQISWLEKTVRIRGI